MPIRLTDLIERVTPEVETKVRRVRDQMQDTVRDAAPGGVPSVVPNAGGIQTEAARRASPGRGDRRLSGESRIYLVPRRL